MEQQQTIRTTFEKTSLINHLPIEFTINDRRNIKFIYPTVEELISDLDLQLFITLINLTKEKIESMNMKLPFKLDSRAGIALNFMAYTEYSELLSKYFTRYVNTCEFKDNALFVKDQKIILEEMEYIIKVILISCGIESSTEEELSSKMTKSDSVSPEIQAILKKQKESEEKIRQIKQKKAEKSGFTIEQVMLAITYEFGIPIRDLIKLNYYAIFWYFGFVGKVDSHKLNQLIISSGFSKKKDYSYWLNK
jgi:hypothetical protein